jgi:hypothetical protein
MDTDDILQSHAKEITAGWFGRLGWHEQNSLKNSVSHTQHMRRQKGIPKINSHPKSQGFSHIGLKACKSEYFKYKITEG